MRFIKKINNSHKFLLSVLVIYGFLSFLNLDLVRTGIYKTFFILVKLFPILILILLISFLINKYLKINRVEKYLGESSGWKGFLFAIVSGILISGPPYILFPLLRDLKKKKMKDSLIAVFLYNRNVKIPFFPVMIYYFGLAFTIIISVYIVLFSILNGILLEFFLKKIKSKKV